MGSIDTALPQSPPSRIISVLYWGARLVLAAVFGFAAVIKLKDPILFLHDIRSYALLQDPWAALIAIFLPWVELWAALGLLLRKLVTGSALILTFSLVVFLGALVSAWARGLSISCGCFGQSEPLNEYSGVIIRDVIFIGLAVFVLFRSLKPEANG